MKRITFAILAIVAAITLQTNTASAFLTNWFVDIDGAAPTYGKTVISEYLDTTGGAAVVLAPDGTFKERAVFVSRTHDKGDLYPSTNPELTAVFNGVGTYTLGSAFTFTGGDLKMYSDAAGDYGTTPNFFDGAGNGNLIGEFNLLFGNGSIDVAGIPNGKITTAFQATSLASGYFFFPDGTTDFASHTNWILGFATVDASLDENPKFNFVNGVGYSVIPEGSRELFIGNGGQFRVVTPEPASMLLFGLGMAGLAVMKRKKA